MRDLMIFAMTIPLIWMSLRNGFVAYALWGWAGLISIQSYLYGFMADLPYVQLFAVISLVQMFFNGDPEKRPLSRNSTSVLLAIFVIHMTISASFAVGDHPRNWELATNMMKTGLFCLLMPLLVTSRLRIHVLVLVIALGIGFHGLVDGLKFISSGGSHQARGIVKFGDNNHYGLVLLMVLPILFYAYLYSVNRIVKLTFSAVIPIVVLGVVATQSRGALVGLVVMAFWFLLKSRRKFVGLLTITFCALLIVQLAPDSWKDRMDTIESADQDSSFLGRVGAWQVSSAIAIRNPFLGVGPHAIEKGDVWMKYRDGTGLLGALPMDLNGLPGRGRAAHSIYFETLGDLGFVGFFIFLAILVNAFKTARDIIHLCDKKGPALYWASNLAQMLKLSTIAYCVSGALLSAAYFELPYFIFMLLQVLKIQVENESSTMKI